MAEVTCIRTEEGVESLVYVDANRFLVVPLEQLEHDTADHSVHDHHQRHQRRRHRLHIGVLYLRLQSDGVHDCRYRPRGRTVCQRRDRTAEVRHAPLLAERTHSRTGCVKKVSCCTAIDISKARQ